MGALTRRIASRRLAGVSGCNAQACKRCGSIVSWRHVRGDPVSTHNQCLFSTWATWPLRCLAASIKRHGTGGRHGVGWPSAQPVRPGCARARESARGRRQYVNTVKGGTGRGLNLDAATARSDAVATSAGRRKVCGALGDAGVLTETEQAEVRAAAPRDRCPLTLGEAGRVAAELGG